MGAFADPGLGASPVWHVFTIDQTGIVFGDDLGVVGDQRIRIDLGALRILGDGLAWAPGAFYDQDGEPDPYCSRGALGRIERRLADAGIDALVGHEMEFLLVGPDGSRLPAHLWAQYGLAGVLEYEGFVRDVTDAATSSGVSIEQFHPEYGVNQFEISLTPQSPIAAADQLMLIRMIVGRVARRYGLRVSLSPVPFAGSVGSGAHQHFSLQKDDKPLFSDGSGATGNDTGGGVRGGRRGGRPARGRGRAVRLHPVRSADAAGPLVGRVRLLGHRKPRGRSAIPRRRKQQPVGRQRRGEGRSTRRRTRTSRRRRSSGSRSTASSAS